MRVVHFTNTLQDGAGKAAYRLHRALLDRGIDSFMLVLQSGREDTKVIGVPKAKGVSLIRKKILWKSRTARFGPRCLFNFNIAFICWDDIKEFLKDVDVVCLYSIQAFLSADMIRQIQKATGAPIVWTPLDIEPMTGGCHFNNECMHFTRSCGDCPQLTRRGGHDISNRILAQKRTAYKELSITFVAGSSTARKCIEVSSIFGAPRIKDVFLGVEETISRTIDQKTARDELDLPEDKKIILFGAFNLQDRRKGGRILLSALKELQSKLETLADRYRDAITLVTIGRQNGFELKNFSFDHVHLGRIIDERQLACIYHAADVLAVPSLDDFGPLMVNQAFMCGTPVVAFHVGVAPDLIKSKKTGYLARNFSAEDFAEGLFKCLWSRDHSEVEIDRLLRDACRSSSQADQYISLFEELTGKTGVDQRD